MHVSSAVACRWSGCKVFGAVSSSCTWLSHHVTSHIPGKPFPCIVAGCRLRFGSQGSLSRHVNSHFKPPSTPHHSGPGRPRGPDSPAKLTAKKTRRKASTRSAGTGTSSKSPDLFDMGVMAGVRDGLARLKPSSRGRGQGVTFDRTGQAVVLYSRVSSRRREEDGVFYLISWQPQGL